MQFSYGYCWHTKGSALFLYPVCDEYKLTYSVCISQVAHETLSLRHYMHLTTGQPTYKSRPLLLNDNIKRLANPHMKCKRRILKFRSLNGNRIRDSRSIHCWSWSCSNDTWRMMHLQFSHFWCLLIFHLVSAWPQLGRPPHPRFDNHIPATSLLTQRRKSFSLSLQSSLTDRLTDIGLQTERRPD